MVAKESSAVTFVEKVLTEVTFIIYVLLFCASIYFDQYRSVHVPVNAKVSWGVC